MVPDGVLSLPGRFPRVRLRADRAVAARDFLIEIKNVHDGTRWYLEAAAAAERCGGVSRRMGTIAREYELRAMELDEVHHGVAHHRAGRHGRRVPVAGPGPVLQRYQEYPPVVGLVAGPRAEVSAPVLALLAVAARAAAASRWRMAGARRVEDAVSFFASTLRRDLAFSIIREEAYLRVTRARRLRAHGRGRRDWAAAADGDAGGALEDAVDDFFRGLEPAFGGHERR